MNNRIDAIYARQSVDKKDSISIESQIEFCKYELKGGNCKEYTDKGYSGKNTDRPKFQELVRDIKRGLIAKVVVYKLDRISRSILDFANMMELFQQYNVEFVSSTEKFDTSTPMGRAMLNICIVFAQLERETIQKRVTDAYYSRSQRGFKMGGKAPYGFHTEPIKMDGINTKKLVVNPEEAANIRLMFEMYAQPTTSYGDITRYFAEQGILFHGKELIRPTLAQMLRNPVYVQADLDVYEFFKSQGTVIVNDVADFTGMNGCYLYQGRDVKASKKNDLKDQMLVLAPHEGIVPSDTWLTCRKKLMNNMKIQSARKATHTWLAGKIKCGNCGYALMSIYNPSGKQYLRCTKRLDNKSCPGCGKIITSELEAVVYQQMVKKLASYKTLTGKKKAAKANPKITALQVELAHVDSEIEKLVDSLTGANNVLFSYVNVKIAELDGRKQELLARIAELTVEAISPEQVSQISGYLDTWENVSFDDKRRVVDLMITTIAATSDSLRHKRQLEHHMENLTGGTPPVRYLPCVVPCKLYFTSIQTSIWSSADADFSFSYNAADILSSGAIALPEFCLSVAVSYRSKYRSSNTSTNITSLTSVIAFIFVLDKRKRLGNPLVATLLSFHSSGSVISSKVTPIFFITDNAAAFLFSSLTMRQS